MKEWLKRSFALLLCMIMCLSLLPEVHVHAEDATGDEIVVVADTQGEEQAVETNTVLDVVQPVRVEFMRDPEELTLTVYDENGEEIEAEEDGSYLLIPGQYSYTATCEGYAAVANFPFELTLQNEEETIKIGAILTKCSNLEIISASDTILPQTTAELNSSSLSSSEVTAKLDQLKATYYEGYESGIQCYQFARDLANKVFGSSPGNPCYLSEGYDSNGWNMIRNPSASDVVLEPGDIIDCRYIYNSAGSTTGHTAIVWKISDGQVYVAESWGSQNGKVHWGLMECQSNAATLSGILEIYGAKFGADNIYIFKRPGAGNSSGSYLSQCTYYPSYLTIEMTTSDYAWTLPCSDQTDSRSQHASSAKLPVGKTLQVTAVYKNTVTTSNHYWYRVDLDGTVAYVYMPYTSIVDDGDDTVQNSVSISGTMPIALTINNSFPADWTIKSPNLDIYSISAYVYGGTNYATQKFGDIMTEINAKEKNLNYSKIDNALAFNTLPEGRYKLTVQVVLHNYHSTGGNNIDHSLIYKTFTYYFTENQPDHAHSYSSTVVAPTCTERGYTEYTCSCGDSYRDNYTSAKGHTWVEGTITTEPTCTEQGEQIDVCSVCSATKTTILASFGHDYIETVIVGSCTQRPGVKYTCTRCGDTYTEYADGNWSEWSTTKPTGVPESAIQTKTQYRYRDKETTTSSSSTLDGWIQSGSETVWSDFGEWSAWSTNYVAESESTQVETRTGYHYYYYVCSNCGAHMHGYGTCYTWAGGCGQSTISSGSYHSARYDTPYSSSLDWHGTGVNYIESSDGKVFAYISTSSQHYVAPATEYRSRTRTQSTIYSFYRWTDWSSWSDTAATASDSREVETRQMYRYDLYATAEHSWNSGVVTTAAGCETEGVRTYTCTACGETRTETIPATGHTAVKDPAVAATCTTAGKTEGSHCSVCNAVIKAQTTIPATGHTAVTDPAVAATCTTAGKTEGSHCSVCNAVIKAQTTIPATGHTAVTDPAVAATCTTAGKTEGSHCSVCGEVIVAQTTIPATGHNFGEWAETRAPSLTEDGEETRTCQNPGCDVSETRAVKAVIYTVSYNANGGTGAPEAQQKLKGAALTLSPTKPVYRGYTFLGWATSSTATAAQYQPGGSYTEDKNVTLYAVWQKAGIEIGQLIVSTPQARPGETVTVDVSIAENPGICAFTLQVSYDETVLELVSIEHPEIGSNSIWNINGGKVSWLSFSDTDYNGTLFTVTFKVADDAEEGTAAVTVLYESGDIGNFAEDEINPSIQAGGVNIVKRVPGDTNGDGRLNTMDLIRLMKYFNGENVEVVPGSADINGDGRENTMDLIRLMKYISGEDVEIH